MNFPQDNALPGTAAKAIVTLKPKNSIDRGRWLFLILMVLFLFAVGYRTVYSVAWNDIERTDFTVYRAAGLAILDNTNIYNAHNIRGWFYVYPPPFAILTVPFAKLSLALGSGLWYLLSVLSLASALFMAVKLARESVPAGNNDDDGWTLYELPLLLVSPWLVSGLMRCQASNFMIWLMLAAIYFGLRGRPVLGGVSLAAATLIKAFPIALLAYFVWQRQWRFVGAFFLFLALGGLVLPAMVYGWQNNLDYWQQWGQIVAGPALSADNSRLGNILYDQLLNSQKPRNQSIEALLLSLKTQQEQTKPLLALIALGMLGVMAWMAKKADAKTQIIVVSAFATWNLLIPPISETHYFGLLLLPLAVLTAFVQSNTDRFSRWLALSVLALYFIFTLWANLDKAMEYYRLLCWATLGIWLSLLALAHRRVKADPDESPAL